MAEGRENTLAMFQAATEMEDLGAAFSCLETADWDLTKALDSFNQQEAAPQAQPSTAPPGASKPAVPAKAPSAFSNNFTVSIEVTFEDQSQKFPVESKDSISDFKTQVSVKFNIPSTHLHLSGWPREVNDQMILADITRSRGKTINLTAERITDESRMVSLQLTYPPDCVVEFQFPEKNNILELKQHVARAEMSGIPVKDQKWSGLPIGTTDYTVIRNSNFKNPIHQLVVDRQFAVAESPVNNTSESMASAIDNQNNPEPIEETYPDPDPDSETDLLDDIEDIPLDNFKDPMIPEHCDDKSKALNLFSENFERRYGPIHPKFFCGSLKEAIDKATQGELLDRRPIAIYLHHDRSISSNIFCEKILCSKPISDFLTNNYLTWAWDMTMPTNTTRFLDSVKMLFGDVILKQLGGGNNPSKFPLLLIFQKNPNSPLEIANILTIDTNPAEALRSLSAGYIDHLAEPVEELLDVVQKELPKEGLPDEPEKGDGVTSIRIRFPSDSVVKNRRFYGSDKIGSLYIYAKSLGFSSDSHRLMFGEKNLAEYPSNQDFKECKLYPHAMVIIKEHLESN